MEFLSYFAKDEQLFDFKKIIDTKVPKGKQLGEYVANVFASSLMPSPKVLTAQKGLKNWHRFINKVLSQAKKVESLNSQVIHSLRVLNDFFTLVDDKLKLVLKEQKVI